MDNKKSTGVTLAIQGEIDVPLPGLMKMVVVPVVQGEFEKLVEKYLDNLIARFGGDVATFVHPIVNARLKARVAANGG